MSMLLLLSGASALVAGPAGGRAALSPVARGRRMAPVAAAAATASSPLDFGVFKSQPTTRVEGDTLKTWDVGATSTERVQLSLQSTGRPVKADVQLWTTPSYIPSKFSVYTEDGNLRPIHAVIETPIHPKTGGAIRSYTFGAEVASVAVLLSSAELGERNMKALIELTSGPNQVKQFFEIYCSSGYKNPFYAVIQTPDPATTIRVINQNTVEFPFEAKVVECDVADAAGSQPEMGGGSFSGGLLR
ncbi:LMBR1-like membrane protein [Aureococcus anophagefferens]|nr:LMBR1-like membrane protein [Aureococcus anophagefferens]